MRVQDSAYRKTMAEASIRFTRECKATALVTRVDEDGVVLSFITIWECMNGECYTSPLPYHEDVRRCLTTSGGDVIYIEILYGRLKVWKLNNNKNDSGTMNPFNADFVYMWSVQDSCLVSGDLLLFIKSQRVGGIVKVVIA
ncbi:hypothetical protein Bca52824_064924 [Brassica carinata]|uniref:F-box protein At3g26010-like beta-propeller domain-containing protein n=1 Tax=Brassica carinata TaxID=52824 RepID=A0A8X7QMX6_BRACI|nr:hypothetical protein Bca52824_064924 [Brassica carinata]